jgi:hypothetical protein
MPIVYADHIEPPLARRWRAPQVLPYHGGHFPPLVPVDRRLSRLHVERTTSLNLNKAKDVFLPSN